jgi:hypothetical protein
MITDQNGKGHVPVPKYFWKIVWDEKVGQATAFIGINNPYLGKVDQLSIGQLLQRCFSVESKIVQLGSSVVRKFM